VKKRLILLIAALGLLAVPSLATATWNPINFPRNGQWYATPGIYYDTPEWLAVQHTGGPTITNYGLWLRRAADGVSIWQAPNTISLYLGSYGLWQWNWGNAPDHQGGTRIWIKAGPADGQITGAYVCGAQGPSRIGCPPL